MIKDVVRNSAVEDFARLTTDTSVISGVIVKHS